MIRVTDTAVSPNAGIKHIINSAIKQNMSYILKEIFVYTTQFWLYIIHSTQYTNKQTAMCHMAFEGIIYDVNVTL